jgi:beta-lactamase superfamily II metal-dependent hydrolase
MAALTVVFLDSGQGDSTLVVFPDGKIMLVDCGCRKNRDVVLPAVIAGINRFLPANGNHIDCLIVTHADEDHYNMIGDVLVATKATVGEVWYGGDVGLYKNMHDGNAMYKYLSANGKSPGSAVFGGNAPWHTTGEVKVYLLACNSSGSPAAADGWTKNTNSIVLLLDYRNYKVFLMGDSTSDTEHFILTAAAAPGTVAKLLENEYATTLKMGHHGSTTSSSEPWVKLLRPNALIISADTRYFSGTGMPRKTHLANVVNWSGNVVATPKHDIVLFDDTLPVPRFDLAGSTVATCSTLWSILYDAAGTGYDAAGGSWHLTVQDTGAVDLSST